MLATFRQTLRNTIRERALNWAERRQGIDPAQVELHRRRVYILPTQQGFIFAVLLFAMVLGSLNYANSMGFVLTFSLASLGFVAMHHTHRNLTGLSVAALYPPPVFVGDVARFPLQFTSHARGPRNSVQLTYHEMPQAEVDVTPDNPVRVDITIPTEHRGWLRLNRFSVDTTFPFGLFRAWAWLRMEQRCLVYPKPAPPGQHPPPAPSDAGSTRTDAQGQGDFSGLRQYHDGDAPRHVAWKASARLQDDLLVKEFAGGGATERWLEWDALENMPDNEQRISRLTRWVIDAERDGDRYGLRLPGITIPLGQGDAHFHACMKALALLEVH